jgi:hypothetical protein
VSKETLSREEDYYDHNNKDQRPENGHHDELSLLYFGWATRRQNYVALVPPKKGSELPTVNEKNKRRGDETNDCEQDAQTREKPRGEEELMDSNPYETDSKRLWLAPCIDA